MVRPRQPLFAVPDPPSSSNHRLNFMFHAEADARLIPASPQPWRFPLTVHRSGRATPPGTNTEASVPPRSPRCLGDSRPAPHDHRTRPPSDQSGHQREHAPWTQDRPRGVFRISEVVGVELPPAEVERVFFRERERSRERELPRHRRPPPCSIAPGDRCSETPPLRLPPWSGSPGRGIRTRRGWRDPEGRQGGALRIPSNP